MIPPRCARRARFLSLLLALAPAGAGAAIYVVTTTDEDTLDNDNCTLREALLAAADDANHDLCIGDAGPDEIVLALAETYPFVGGEIVLSGRELRVHSDPELPFGSTFVDLGGSQRFLSATNGSDLTIEHLVFLDGKATGRGGTIEAVDSDLTMHRVAIDFSSATEGGGAISFEATTARTLDLERVELQSNGATGPGGALFVDLSGGGSVRLVEMRFVDNGVSEPPGGVDPRVGSVTGVIPNGALVGGALALAASGTVALELRHLDLEINGVSAAADAVGGGAWIFATGGGSVVAEDLYVVGNTVSAGAGNDVSGLALAVHGPSLDFRRLLAQANSYGGGDDSVLQARIDVGIGSSAEVSDVAVVSGSRSGLAMSATGGSCSLRAGNLTVAGHNIDGLALTESGGCTLTLENSIVAKNAAWGFSNPLNLRISGNVTVSAETIDGDDIQDPDPKFASSVTGDYRLASDSPARNAGIVPSVLAVGPFDANHGTRVLESFLDLGAYEFGAIFADDFERGARYAWTAFTD